MKEAEFEFFIKNDEKKTITKVREWSISNVHV